MKRVLIILGLVAVACSPKLSQPTVNIPDSYSNNCGDVASSDSTQMWWHSVGDERLCSLVEEALSSNLSLQASMTAIRAARYNLRVARSAYLPDLSFNIEAERLREEKVYESEYEVVPTLSWQIPLFGAYRSTSQVSKAKILTAEYQTQGVALTLASEVANAYYSIIEYRCALRVAERSYELRLQATALVDSMHRYGMSSGVDLSQAQALVAAAQEDVSKYTQSLALSEISLATLLSCNVDSIELRTPILCDIDSLPPIVTPAVGIPSDLLYNRPDLREAYFKIEEAMGEVGLARSAQFPSISLTVDGGLYSSSLKGLTLSKLLTWEWAVDLVQPIFNFGALRAKKLSLTESYNATLLEYQQSIITALGDVESALVSIEQSRKQSLSSREYMDKYAKIATATRALYRGGMDDYLSVVDAEREFYTSQIDYIALRTQQYINLIDLYTALGGVCSQ